MNGEHDGKIERGTQRKNYPEEQDETRLENKDD